MRMQKTLFSLSALLLAGTSMAVTPNQLRVNRDFTVPVSNQQVNQNDFSHSQSARMVETPPITQFKPHRSPKITADSEPIFEAPEGTEVTYSRSGYGFYFSMGYAMFGKEYAAASFIVWGDDGYAYIYNPFCGCITNSYLKCEVRDNKLIAELPQAIYQAEDYDDPTVMDTYYAAILTKVEDENGYVDYVVADSEASKTISWTIEDDKLILDMEYDATPDEDGYLRYPDTLFGMVSADEIWNAVGDCAQTSEKADYKTVELPEDLKIEEWVLISDGVGKSINVAFDGDDIYVSNLTTYFPDAWVKGTITDNKVIFESKQYMGLYSRMYFIFFMGGTYDDETYYLADNITFEFDAEKKVMISKEGECMMLNTTLDVVYYLSMFNVPILKVRNMNPAPNPSNPIPKYYYDYFDNYGYSFYAFNLPDLNEDNDLLNTENMYYEVYLDDELFVFDTADYTIEESMSQVPYSFSNGRGIFANGLSHYVSFYTTGFETIGLRLFNVVDGKTYASDMVVFDIENNSYYVGMEDIVADKNMAKVEFYDLQGVRVSNPYKGFYLCKKTFDDGTSKISKILIK